MNPTVGEQFLVVLCIFKSLTCNRFHYVQPSDALVLGKIKNVDCVLLAR